MGNRNFVIEQDTGKNLQQVISGVLVKSPIEAIKELVSNSYDADSKKVVIKIDEKKQEILVEDDGSGISEKGLDDFMRMGDSNKLTNPVSLGGRRRIGKFGIAKVLLEFLGDEYQIDTWCDGSYISGTERFRNNKTNGLEYIIEQRDNRKTGTSILIKGARFVETKQFSLKSLKHALTWEVPNQEDFTIFLNSERLVRRNTNPAQKFYFRDKLLETGDIEMEVDYFIKPPKISGVFVYINGRVVGSTDFESSKTNKNLAKRLFVSVNANGLQEHIAFNRAYIKEDNRAYAEVKKYIYDKLAEVKNAVSSAEATPARAGVSLSIKTRMQKALKEFSPLKQQTSTQKASDRDGLTDFYLSQKLRNTPKEKPEFSRTQIVDTGASGAQARVNSATQEFLINAGHPWYNSPETSNLEILKAHILLGTAFALSWERHLQDSGSKDSMDNFYSLCAKLLKTKDNADEIRDRVGNEGMFVAFKRYNIGEIISEYMSLACLHELVDAGVLEIHNETILGSQLNEYMEKAINYTPAVDVVREYALTMVNKQTGRKITRERVRQRYSKINYVLYRIRESIPFIYNIGEKKPFFLVRNEDISRFLGLYAQGVFDGGGDIYTQLEKHRDLFNKLCKTEEDRSFVGLELLCEASRSSPDKVFRIISYAQKRGVPLSLITEGEVVKYSLENFRAAREQFLTGGKNGC